MDFRRLLIGTVFAVCGSANASTVFMATDGNVNFFNINLATNATLAMFDDNDVGTYANALVIPLPSQVDIVSDGLGDFTATNVVNNNSITLTTNTWYALAVSTDNGTSWSSDSFVSCDPGSGSCSVAFSNGTVLSVDSTVAAVPVPTAVWLFGSGLLGLVGVARRKKAA